MEEGIITLRRENIKVLVVEGIITLRRESNKIEGNIKKIVVEGIKN